MISYMKRLYDSVVALPFGLRSTVYCILLMSLAPIIVFHPVTSETDS